MLSNVNDLASSTPNHIGVVVENAEKTSKFLSSMCGLGSWSAFKYSPGKDDLILGEPFGLNIAVAKWGATVIELLQPLTSGSVWSNFLETNGEGLHHLALTVTNYDDMVLGLKQQGASMLVSGHAPSQFNGRPWCYFDTKPGGLIIEFMDSFGF
jgi:hypothetical protein